MSEQSIQFETVETCRCLNCDAQIRREHVEAKLVSPRDIAPTRQIVSAWCEHCRLMYQVERVLRDGVWTLCGKVELVNDVASKVRLLRRLNEKLQQAPERK